jgi:hypothetical protein
LRPATHLYTVGNRPALREGAGVDGDTDGAGGVRTTGRIALAVVVAVALAPAAAAEAAGWKQVTATSGSAIDQVGTLRTADGVLHVAWHRRSGPNTEDMLHTRIEPNGRVGATTPINIGWAGMLDAALTPVPGGIRAFWGGIRTTESLEPNRELNSALSLDGGATWALQIGSVAPAGAQVYGSDVSAATLSDGTPLQAWSGTLGTWVHSGIDPATPNHDYQAPLGSYGNFPGIAADAAGRAVMAWFSSATGHVGVLAQDVAHDGSPVGGPVTMPGTQVMIGNGTVTRTPIVARSGGGFYVAYPVGYPSPTQVRLWRVGAGKSTLIARAAGNPSVAVAPDGAGRLWVAWSAGTFGSKRILARRSNRSATVFGATVSAGVAKGANSVAALDAGATAGAVDLLALFGIGTQSGGATYVKRVLPGLTVRATPRKLPARPVTVTFTVTDAGDPVEGAKVKAGGGSDVTDAKGRATLTLKGKATVRAAAKGYTAARLELK